MSAYMRISNQTRKTVVLTGASSSAFTTVMIHRTEIKGGMARMRHQHRLDIAAGKGLTFRPGGYHLMLMRPKKELKPGDVVNIELRFDHGKTLSVGFKIRKIGG